MGEIVAIQTRIGCLLLCLFKQATESTGLNVLDATERQARRENGDIIAVTGRELSLRAGSPIREHLSFPVAGMHREVCPLRATGMNRTL